MYHIGLVIYGSTYRLVPLWASVLWIYILNTVYVSYWASDLWIYILFMYHIGLVSYGSTFYSTVSMYHIGLVTYGSTHCLGTS